MMMQVFMKFTFSLEIDKTKNAVAFTMAFFYA
jgi:hypothetical protein